MAAYNSSEQLTLQTDFVTLTRFILDEQHKVGTAATGDLSMLLNHIQLTCKFIAHNIRRATLINLIGLAGAANKSGEEQKKLDVLGNKIFVDAMKACGKVGIIISEEEEEPIFVAGDGKYAVVCDPIDGMLQLRYSADHVGSSNLDAGVSVGTIFGIYKLPDDRDHQVEDVLRPGKEMICAGYCMYAASANLVLTTGNGVNGFTLDNSLGEFILTHPNLRIPESRNIYSVNEGNSVYWHEPEPYSARYIGSMVADVHRTILYGGIFAYPSDKKSRDGKLRLLYECFPMAFLIEQAGGIAWNGKQRILDVVPKGIHARGPVWLGSKKEILKAQEIFKKYD
ncbi:Fructose-1,6-bisphosphatase, cytosolic [Neolecta irregularis DAH-3]|uniref:Fructose-1,6-bisphosphatase n=1 Tax=Neolecta irregularis (strain DAH-3) TaxID=1198029 RepID=A0A1U7LQ62_NEOID|nr:Fructose-1,6-bisphosphatase, cytosolic [Neolecta irregularis DAH-3]|eukprot:OLL24723.1 Fructose-1,6-bisphosphatase, cytosolic [Neolecta irregularis DAH-3]